VNPKFTEATGYSVEEVLGKNPRLLKSGRQPPEFYKQMWETITAGHDWRGDICNRKKNGGLFWESAVIAPIKDEHGTITHFMAIKEDVTELKQLQREVLEISEREQARIGRDLHDGACQSLAGVAILIDAAVRDMVREKSNSVPLIRRTSKILRETVHEIRNLAMGLFPAKIADRGLAWALQDLASEIRNRYHINCRFLMPRSITITDPNATIHLYRIAQEAIGNAMRHGHARNISLELAESDGRVSLVIQDDGRGLPRRQKKWGLGMHSMRYRAKMLGGWLNVCPAVKRGTDVICSFPGKEFAYVEKNKSGKKKDISC
jgi:PAS domain S-box-containing protein